MIQSFHRFLSPRPASKCSFPWVFLSAFVSVSVSGAVSLSVFTSASMSASASVSVTVSVSVSVSVYARFCFYVCVCARVCIPRRVCACATKSINDNTWHIGFGLYDDAASIFVQRQCSRIVSWFNVCLSVYVCERVWHRVCVLLSMRVRVCVTVNVFMYTCACANVCNVLSLTSRQCYVCDQCTHLADAMTTICTSLACAAAPTDAMALANWHVLVISVKSSLPRQVRVC